MDQLHGYLDVLRITNSESYTRRLLLWLKENNPQVLPRLEAELEKARRASKEDPLPSWLRA